MSAARARCSWRDRLPTARTRTEWTAINSCLVPAASLDGQEVVTAEGLGDPDDLHPVQHRVAVRGGSQCGYCTPGFVCSMAAEFDRAAGLIWRPTARAPAAPTTAYHGDNGFDLHALSGNLCRCTGYRPIMDAAYALGFPDRRTTGSPHAVRRPRRRPPRPGCTTAEVPVHPARPISSRH